jgi:hypothetical protein
VLLAVLYRNAFQFNTLRLLRTGALILAVRGSSPTDIHSHGPIHDQAYSGSIPVRLRFDPLWKSSCEPSGLRFKSYCNAFCDHYFVANELRDPLAAAARPPP